MCTTVALLVFLDGLFPCVFPSLVMRVGGVGCHPGAVLELGGVSGCVLCLGLGGVCLQVVLGKRERR